MASHMTDEDLMARLRDLGSQVDPVPDDVVMAARSALAYRDLDVRLAELVDESTPAGAGVRSDAADSWLTFEVDDVVIEVAVHVRSGKLHLVGHIDGSPVDRVSIVGPGGAMEHAVDELGRFAAPIQPGPVRVETLLSDGRRLVTSWVVAPKP